MYIVQYIYTVQTTHTDYRAVCAKVSLGLQPINWRKARWHKFQNMIMMASAKKCQRKKTFHPNSFKCAHMFQKF